jgi:F-type H+-transporting ATPase subunit b
MTLDWSTFLLEILNFLVLVWLLKRFLYRPVLEVIEQRKTRVEKALQDAQAAQAQAQALREQHESRLADWQKQQEHARAQLHTEIEAERQTQMEALRASLQDERERRKLLQTRQEAALASQVQSQALLQAGAFAGRLLARVAGPEAEARLAAMLIEALARLPEARVAEVRRAVAEQPGPVRVTSAYPLPEETRAALAAALERLLTQRPQLEFGEDEKLVAGLRVAIGPWVLRASVQDELELFVHAGSDG